MVSIGSAALVTQIMEHGSIVITNYNTKIEHFTIYLSYDGIHRLTIKSLTVKDALGKLVLFVTFCVTCRKQLTRRTIRLTLITLVVTLIFKI